MTVVSHLEVEPEQSVLNVGSGSGYLSTVVGCLLKGKGVNHGVDLDQVFFLLLLVVVLVIK